MRSFARRILDFVTGRTINAGGYGPRWGDRLPMVKPASEIHARRGIVEGRAADLRLNNPYASAIVLAYCTDVIGDGPAIRPIAAGEPRTALENYGDRFYDDCDAEGLTNLGGLLHRVMASLVVSGETFVQMLVDEATGALRLKLLPPSQLDNRDVTNADGSRIEKGIEFSASGKRLAYHFRKVGDGRMAGTFETVRIPASDILHVFEPIVPGQQRGLSWLTSSATHLAEINRLEDALLAQQNTAALFGLIFSQPDGGAGLGKVDAKGDYTPEPGSTIIAPPGYNVDTITPPTVTGSSEFLRSMIRSASAGSGVPYEFVSGDLSQTNYSSSRVGLLKFRRRCLHIQKNLLVARLLDPAWRRGLLLEALADRMDMALAQNARTEFTFPGFEPVDPQKETRADIEAIGANIKSRHEVIAARGRDPAVVDEEIQTDALGSKARPQPKDKAA